MNHGGVNKKKRTGAGMSLKLVVDNTKKAAKDTKKSDRSKEVQKVKMPGINPAMASMSVFSAKMYDEIMVKQLGKAVTDKLKELTDASH